MIQPTEQSIPNPDQTPKKELLDPEKVRPIAWGLRQLFEERANNIAHYFDIFQMPKYKLSGEGMKAAENAKQGFADFNQFLSNLATSNSIEAEKEIGYYTLKFSDEKDKTPPLPGHISLSAQERIKFALGVAHGVNNALSAAVGLEYLALAPQLNPITRSIIEKISNESHLITNEIREITRAPQIDAITSEDGKVTLVPVFPES